MKPVIIYTEPRPVTLGELCEALADGTMPAALSDNFYNVRKPDVARYKEIRHMRETRALSTHSAVNHSAHA